MANLRIAQPLLLSCSTQNRFKRLYFWLKFLSDLVKGVVAPSPAGCATAYTVGARGAETRGDKWNISPNNLTVSPPIV